MTDFFGYGRWLSSCGTTFLFSKANVRERVFLFLAISYLFIQKTWEGAVRTCRAIGMEVLAVEYDDKDGCIAKLAASKYVSIFLVYF
jgi:hypothetical protein